MVIKDKAQPLGHYPHVKRVGDFIYVSGTSSRRADNTHVGAEQDESGQWHLDIKAQTKAVIENIIALIGSMGADKSHLIDMNTFLVDMKDFKGYNEVYGTFFDHTGPTRTTCLLYTSPSPRDATLSRMPSSA